MKVFCEEACVNSVFDEDSKKWICIRKEIRIGGDRVCVNFLNLKGSIGWYGRNKKELGICG